MQSGMDVSDITYTFYYIVFINESQSLFKRYLITCKFTELFLIGKESKRKFPASFVKMFVNLVDLWQNVWVIDKM